MVTPQVFPPFPPEINRDDFGHYLAGLVDGEGCFALGHYHRSKRRGENRMPRMFFLIGLRADDRDIILLIASYFGRGRVNEDLRTPDCPRWNPKILYRVSDTFTLTEAIIPHFERYPLRAKKKRDFDIWKVAVKMAHAIRLRKHNGPLPTWTAEERETFERYRLAVTETRRYVTGGRVVDIPPPKASPGLFDDLA